MSKSKLLSLLGLALILTGCSEVPRYVNVMFKVEQEACKQAVEEQELLNECATKYFRICEARKAYPCATGSVLSSSVAWYCSPHSQQIEKDEFEFRLEHDPSFRDSVLRYEFL